VSHEHPDAARRIAIQTFGCRLNQSDSEGMRAALLAAGHTIVSPRDTADIYVINTCSITGQAEADARRAVRRAVERGAGGARIVVTGCYAQRAPAEVAALPGVELVVGNDRKTELPELIGETSPSARTAVGDIGAVSAIAEFPVPLDTGRTRAYLRVQDGCEDRCTFCVVPETRGGFRSLPVGRAVERLGELVAAGYREIVLTGANLSSYGAERPDGPVLHDLLAALLTVPGDFRLRLSSFEPSDVTPELVELLADAERLCRHLHLPAQSLDDGVLERMRRSYDAATVAAIATRLRRRIPGLALGTDLMVGFPGESESAFQTTRQRLESLPFTYFHVFPYSPRPGTAAGREEDDVPREVKRRRSLELRELGSAKAAAFAGSQVGHPVRVLVERSDASGQYLRGYTDNYLRVRVPADGGPTNRFVALELEPAHLETVQTGQVPGPSR
jgi:threonylcarbamoyladenosine tRNA methylthiotransferase MtaB